MWIMAFTTTKPWKEHKGHHRPAVAVGKVRYAIRYSRGGYFTYSYLDRSDALQAINNMRYAGTDTLQFYPFNLQLNIEDTIPVAPKAKR